MIEIFVKNYSSKHIHYSSYGLGLPKAPFGYLTVIKRNCNAEVQRRFAHTDWTKRGSSIAVTSTGIALLSVEGKGQVLRERTKVVFDRIKNERLRLRGRERKGKKRVAQDNGEGSRSKFRTGGDKVRSEFAVVSYNTVKSFVPHADGNNRVVMVELRGGGNEQVVKERGKEKPEVKEKRKEEAEAAYPGEKGLQNYHANKESRSQ
ncbi:hypothetical protein K435DRAFT_798414 [Dendrothele bispora CBS 962.96]|uniref:Uncharacterized protein n=1 Tax=Dendrothele bispora (strain CBS 962.96) TaxID=1314807 RepID=A0A4S8LZA8_DENBC|nr:hypothetical protein K435DRAFT_798414 [Dendrothele bispora CBS 962.96]